MNKAIMVTVAASALLAAPAAAAQAHITRPAAHHCASHDQYRKVKHGMTVSRVARILGHRGKMSFHDIQGGYGSMERAYPVCASEGDYSDISVDFHRTPHHKTWRVDGKSGLFL